ncbi:MAG: lysophospholipid acyltransferase family protein [Muribaculaceae bacterium]|nr:lysophospholipid acyltransferase family protein [Muribaculaceae bacterium]
MTRRDVTKQGLRRFIKREKKDMDTMENAAADAEKKREAANKYKDYDVRPDVMNAEDIMNMVPQLRGHDKLVKKVMHLLMLDEVNRVHGAWCYDPGPAFARHLLDDEFHVPLKVDNEEILANFKEGAFITVSNHPFGSIDGIALIALVTKYRPEYKVMVNMILGKISAMGPNFIKVDQSQSAESDKRRVSVNGIREAIRQLKNGEPLGFFPAGAMSKSNWHNFLVDREWQHSVLQIIAKAKVPVIPIYFHGNNSWWFNFWGHVCWPLRSLLLPRQLFNHKKNREMHISIGEPITPEEQARFKGDAVALGKYLREKTYELARK